MVSVGIGLPCLYESRPLLDHRRAPLRASGTLCTTPPPIARSGPLLFHPCRFHPFGCANLAYQRTEDEENRLLSLLVMVFLYPCYPQMRVLLLFFFQTHNHPWSAAVQGALPRCDAVRSDPSIFCVSSDKPDLSVGVRAISAQCDLPLPLRFAGPYEPGLGDNRRPQGNKRKKL
ncbi:hypothetical protein M431DRAFT_244375 [Trichoderma harzianum CBS 226.95]|uniref:Uncharacterized protein n=1 Tax=Trichoderma harzianum CBS 226.95 TaxID=983964 RepID=A0A2T4A0V5_TRIHA|nr:hypothetical protein M431DRAFT_244375 [Trichoderma harzianum CBS 226.95]PTB50702.1 hypothetical protein M431DRAFT_244375 [Trichoderma harzianum CBS 226.95]